MWPVVLCLVGRLAWALPHQDWATFGQVGREQPRCVHIPHNFSLCHGIQYDVMRLPNLLEHDTVAEAIQQSDAWNSLLRLHCHPETKIFLCSLFAPVCLPEMDKIIYPCKSLCEKVKKGCEPRMRQYGFDWPEMMGCDKFPADNDMCIRSTEAEEPRSSRPHSQTKRDCQSCAQVPTFENLLDNFCRSGVVFKAKLNYHNATHFKVQRVQRVFKPKSAAKVDKQANDKSQKKIVGPNEFIRIGSQSDCKCPAQKKTNSGKAANYLVMTDPKAGVELNARLILAWQHDKVFKSAVRRFNKVDCSSLGREIRERTLKQSKHGY